jgi:hypothetical protein
VSATSHCFAWCPASTPAAGADPLPDGCSCSPSRREQAGYSITETFFTLTIFTLDLDATMICQFSALLFVKVEQHWARSFS